MVITSVGIPPIGGLIGGIMRLVKRKELAHGHDMVGGECSSSTKCKFVIPEVDSG